MSKVTLTLGSFIVGACSVLMLLLPFTQTSTRAQSAIAVPAAEPKVPPMSVHLVGGSFVGATQALDGIDCVGCTIKTGILTYAGGAFRCANCSVSAGQVVLKGAALNTFNALQFFGVIPVPKPPKRLPTPTQQNNEANEIQITPQQNVNWVALAGLKQ